MYINPFNQSYILHVYSVAGTVLYSVGTILMKHTVFALTELAGLIAHINTQL